MKGLPSFWSPGRERTIPPGPRNVSCRMLAPAAATNASCSRLVIESCSIPNLLQEAFQDHCLVQGRRRSPCLPGGNQHWPAVNGAARFSPFQGPHPSLLRVLPRKAEISPSVDGSATALFKSAIQAILTLKLTSPLFKNKVRG